MYNFGSFIALVNVYEFDPQKDEDLSGEGLRNEDGVDRA